MYDQLVSSLQTEKDGQGRETIVLAKGEESLPVLPYDSLLMPMPAELQKRIAEAQCRTWNRIMRFNHVGRGCSGIIDRRVPSASPAPCAGESGFVVKGMITEPAAARKQKLRIGYLSYDFSDHPMGHLTAGLLEHADRRRFEVHAYGYGPDDKSPQRQHIVRVSDSFANISGMPETDAAGHIAQDAVDIVVDLMAHTRGTKLGIASLKPAPLVVNYLGFPGTMGST